MIFLATSCKVNCFLSASYRRHHLEGAMRDSRQRESGRGRHITHQRAEVSVGGWGRRREGGRRWVSIKTHQDSWASNTPQTPSAKLQPSHCFWLNRRSASVRIFFFLFSTQQISLTLQCLHEWVPLVLALAPQKELVLVGRASPEKRNRPVFRDKVRSRRRHFVPHHDGNGKQCVICTMNESRQACTVTSFPTSPALGTKSWQDTHIRAWHYGIISWVKVLLLAMKIAEDNIAARTTVTPTVIRSPAAKQRLLLPEKVKKGHRRTEKSGGRENMWVEKVHPQWTDGPKAACF